MVLLPVIFRPQALDQDRAKTKDAVGHVERRAVAADVHRGGLAEGREEQYERSVQSAGDLLRLHHIRRELRDDTSEHGADGVPETREAQGLTQQLWVEASAVVLAHKPGIEDAEEQGRRDAPAEPPEQQHVVVVDVLGEVMYDVAHAVDNRSLLAAHRVGHRAHPRAEHHRTPEADHEEDGVVPRRDSVGLVDRVDVRTLEPV
mmetsp:Transcript_15490/g.42610  ORF Transcript_15490/g.42610 Transcript_15490/m.42610 type:complete len:203 (+) Transcript_15490:968-1576(+)